MVTTEGRIARVEGEQAGTTKRLDDMNSRLNDMSTRLNILTAAIITQTIAIAGLIATVLLNS